MAGLHQDHLLLPKPRPRVHIPMDQALLLQISLKQASL